MGHDWIIGVLADLRNFARQNQMPLLREQLEEAELVAAIEIASLKERVTQTNVVDPAVIAKVRANGDSGHNA